MSDAYIDGVREFADTVEQLSLADSYTAVWAIASRGARALTGADGASLILRDGDECHYVDENAVGTLWKGQRFPSDACVSGWVMDTASSVVISDIDDDDRVPLELYEPTFVRSLVVVPIRRNQPVGAIGAYWAQRNEASERDVAVLEALANATSVTIERLSVLEELETRVSARTDELEQANQALSRFASVASHDLRSPLATIHGLLETVLTRRTSPLDSMDETLVTRARAQTGALLGTVQALLQLARIDTQPLTVQPVDLGPLIDDVVASLADEFGRDTKGAISYHGATTVFGDRDLLRILFQNLLTNALKFHAAERDLQVDVRVAATSQGWRITVTDNGIGVDPADRERIFEIFARTADGERRDGHGIGLATARRIAARHGGTIHVEPQQTGTRFVIALPAPGIVLHGDE